MNNHLNNKIAVVTGGSRGIGQAIAKALHNAGAKVAITGRDIDTLTDSVKNIGQNCIPFVCDVTNPEDIQKMSEEIKENLGTPDILVNNAGMMKSQPVKDMSHDLWNSVIATNLTGPFLVTQTFLPGMIQKDAGDIIMISSMSGKKGDPGAAAYAASKFGLQGFSQSLMYEVRKHNIRVTVLNPSRVDVSKRTSLDCGKGKTLHADDIASTVLHIVSLPRCTMIRDMDIFGTNP